MLVLRKGEISAFSSDGAAIEGETGMHNSGRKGRCSWVTVKTSTYMRAVFSAGKEKRAH